MIVGMKPNYKPGAEAQTLNVTERRKKSLGIGTL